MITYELAGVDEPIVIEDAQPIIIKLDKFSVKFDDFNQSVVSNDLMEEILKYIANEIFEIVINNNSIHYKDMEGNCGQFEWFKEEYYTKNYIKSYEFCERTFKFNRNEKIFASGDLKIYFKNMLACILKDITMILYERDNNFKYACWSGTIKLVDLKYMTNCYCKKFFKLKDKIYCVDLYFKPNEDSYMEIPKDQRFLYPYVEPMPEQPAEYYDEGKPYD